MPVMNMSSLFEQREGKMMGRFVIESHYTEDQILGGLKKLRDLNFTAEIDFSVDGISWTERIRQEMITTFEHYNNLGRQWSSASFLVNFHLDPEEETSVHAHLVLQSPATTKRFKTFYFSRYEGELETELATSIAFLLKNGRSVAIEGLVIGYEAMSVFADGLVTPAGSVNITPTPQKLDLDYISFRNDERSLVTRTVQQSLADGLARNKTLTKFGWDQTHAIDSVAAVIVQGLVGHPSLNELCLSEVKFGDLSIDAICRLLSSPTCNVSDLTLDHFTGTEGGAGFDLRRFIDQLPTSAPVNHALRRLSFYDDSIPDHDAANYLLRNLWKLPSLKYLELTWSNNPESILNLVRLASGLEMTTTTTTRYSRLREFDLQDNTFDFGRDATMSDEHSTRAILNLLDAFPELGYLGCGVAAEFPASVQERLDMNRCSGMLLRGAEIPLSVWAVVLAKVNSDEFVGSDCSKTPRRANVIYTLLHGPVFGGRGPLV